MKRLLHIGCGSDTIERLDFIQDKSEWTEVRIDMNPVVCPDFLYSITDLGIIPSNSFDMVYASHIIEHLKPSEVPVAMGECKRVLKDGGALVVVCPDLIGAMELGILRGLAAVAYVAPGNFPVTVHNIIFGLPDEEYMAHHCGFGATELRQTLQAGGFYKVDVQECNDYNLMGVAIK